MKKISRNNLLILCFFALFSCFPAFAQKAEVNIQQDEKIAELLATKQELSQNSEIRDRFNIQLFYGNNGEANEVIKKYRENYDYPSSIVYEEPNYKVWVGNFRNRLEADRALLKIKEDFPGAIIPKPKRK